MKKLIAAFLSLVMLISLCACGHKDKNKDDIIIPPPDNPTGGETQTVQNEQPAPPVVLPPIDTNADYFRGTWISISGQNVSDTLDHYYDSDKNYMTLSPNGTGSLVLGANYRDLTWTQDENSLSFSFPATGESCKGTIINDIIYELEYGAGGSDVSLTFIKIEDKD